MVKSFWLDIDHPQTEQERVAYAQEVAMSKFPMTMNASAFVDRSKRPHIHKKQITSFKAGRSSTLFARVSHSERMQHDPRLVATTRVAEKHPVGA